MHSEFRITLCFGGSQNIQLLRGSDQDIELTWKSFPIDILKPMIGREKDEDILEIGWCYSGSPTHTPTPPHTHTPPHAPSPILGNYLMRERETRMYVF